MDMSSTLDYLEKRLTAGFCLHGSPRKFDVVEPRKACCQSGRPEGNLTAVYASRYSAQIPIVMALMFGKGHSTYTGENGYLTVAGTRTFAPGFVYVLNTETFTDQNGEFVSYVPVTPEEVVPVDPSILRLLIARGTLELHIPIPAPW